MSDLLAQTVDDLLSGAPEPAAGWDPGLWARLGELGLTGVGVPEAYGGAGGTLADAAVVARACGYHAAAVPYADHVFVAAWALVRAGMPLPGGPLTAVPASHGVIGGDAATGVLAGVPWGRHAAHVVVLAPESPGGDGVRVAVLDPAHARVAEGANAAGEPRDDLTVDGAPVRSAVVPGMRLRDVRARGALARAVALTGAARRVLDLTVRYAGEREQFGRPIGRFQAVQQELAGLAGAVEQAAAMAAHAVALADDAGDAGDAAYAAAAAAKICAGRAAGLAVATGHQVHGALGFTQEHVLHRFTRRLLAWRDEHGAEPVWCAELGDAVAAGGAEGLWALLTGAPARA